MLPTFRSIGVIPIFALYAYHSNPRFYVISPRHHAWMALEGLLGNTIAQQCFNYGAQLSSASLAGMIQPVIPCLTTCLAIALRREGISRAKVVGIVIAVAGSFLMVVGSGGGGADSSASSNYPLGAFLFLVQCTCTSLYIIIQKPLFAQGLDVRTFTFYLFLYGGVGHVLIGAFFLPSVQWSALPLSLIPILLYTILIATFAAFSLFVFATNNLPASVSALGITLQSFFSPVLGALFLGEVITWVDALGGVAIVTGIVVVVLAKSAEGKAATAAAAASKTCSGHGWTEETGASGSRGDGRDHSRADRDGESEDEGDVQLTDSDDDDDDISPDDGYPAQGNGSGHVQPTQRLNSDDYDDDADGI